MHRSLNWITSCAVVIVSMGISNFQPLEIGPAQRFEDLPLYERLTYKVTWLGISIGTGEIWVKEKTELNGRPAFHVVGTFQTNKFLSTIYPIHDEAHSWIDAETLQSLAFEKKISEGGNHTHERTVYDPQKKKGYFESFKTGEKKEFDVILPTHDPFSVFYWARRQTLVPGKTPKTILYADQISWLLELNVIREERLKFQDKSIDTLLVEPKTLFQGEKRGRSKIHLTRDSFQKPLRVTYKAPFGSIIGTLQLQTEKK